MNIYLIAIILMALINIKFFVKDFNKDYLSKDNTACIKGIFILIVFYSHFVAYTEVQMAKDSLMFAVRNFLGQLMVTMFLFYSGYGVYESIKKKKDDYIKTFPKKRILSTLFHFDIAVLLFAIVNYIIGNPKSISQIFWALTGWGGIGNSNWYIFAIIFLYIGTYVSFTLLPKDHKTAIKLNWIYTILLMIVIATLRGKGFEYCYNTLMCYPLGLSFSYYKDKIDKVLHNNKNYLLTLPIILISFIVIKENEYINTIWYSMTSVLFVLSLVLINMKVNLNSKLLKWFGDNLFWIYILQRIPMLILSKTGYAMDHTYRFALISFVCTILMTIVFKKLFEKIDKKLFAK